MTPEEQAMADSNPYVTMQQLEWELQATKIETTTLQVTVTLLKTEKEDLENKLSVQENEHEETLKELDQTDKRLQDAIEIYRANERELQERISFLELEVAQGSEELVDRISYLENKLKESERQVQVKEAALETKEKYLELKEHELEERERECERVSDFFAAGNDVNGLILDFQGRLKKQEDELHKRDQEIVSLRVKLERAEQEKLAITQTLASQVAPRTEKIRRKDHSSREQPGVKKRPVTKQNSLPTVPPVRNPQHWRMSLDVPTIDERRIYDKPTPPAPVYRRLPFSLEWSKPYPLDPRKRMVNGVSVYCQKDNTLYFSSVLQQEILVYQPSKEWSSLPKCPHQFFGLAFVDDNLTAVGGKIRERPPSIGAEGSRENGIRTSFTNKLISYVGTPGEREESWVELFPPMPTKRAYASAVCASRSLIVAGGDNGIHLQTVEVMDTGTKQWFNATSLPKALNHPSMVLCGTTNRIYLLGEEEKGTRQAAVYNCSVYELLRTKEPIREVVSQPTTHIEEDLYTPCPSRATIVWKELPKPPMLSSTLAVINSHVVTVGGIDSKSGASNKIHYLDISHSKWERIAHMPTARHTALVGVNPSNQKLIVIGGCTKMGLINTVEIANTTS